MQVRYVTGISRSGSAGPAAGSPLSEEQAVYAAGCVAVEAPFYGDRLSHASLMTLIITNNFSSQMLSTSTWKTRHAYISRLIIPNSYWEFCVSANYVLVLK